MNTWYEQLTRPYLSPPSWVFGPVWTVLYIMIACSIILYFRTSARPYATLTLIVLLVHLAANLAWTSLFFGFNSLLLSLLDIIVLDVTLVALIFLFWKTSAAAAALLLPYLLWICFATYLNAAYFVLNRA